MIHALLLVIRRQQSALTQVQTLNYRLSIFGLAIADFEKCRATNRRQSWLHYGLSLNIIDLRNQGLQNLYSTPERER